MPGTCDARQAAADFMTQEHEDITHAQPRSLACPAGETHRPDRAAPGHAGGHAGVIGI